MREGDYVMIDNKIKITFSQRKGKSTTLSFEAPYSIKILRGKFIEKNQKEKD